MVGDSFRELEKPQAGRLKDIVLMATVSGFESLARPSRSDLKQFHELFVPLYLASSDEARRQAVAALSQCAVLPEELSHFIAREPIAIAAIFLTRSQALSQRVLLEMLREASPDHARAIERRDDLSPQLIEALVGLHQAQRSRSTQNAPADTATATEANRQAREEELREEIKALARAQMPQDTGIKPLAPVEDAHLALIVRFARAGETGMLGVVLADALDASQWLSERILLDVSGRQLATAFVALDAPRADSSYVLLRLYPHLAQASGSVRRADLLLSGLDRPACIERVESWRRADAYTHSPQPRTAANSDTGDWRKDNAARRA
ncbi:uncharacterized protein SAMN05892877_101396 [Rhizobium subbaraonis]|uniref:DUF2336 domain-containing protein n=1 Tax=Rhizobium subbaraonis TaxID=908946 RepID=A0A285U256_9HYPH|nr:hypothetical protein [Rhizobium subbaraonis]SOC35518.1 uncharacterized protein SAMN05892877_101396 [Rhizobium subbaraonis]